MVSLKQFEPLQLYYENLQLILTITFGKYILYIYSKLALRQEPWEDIIKR